MTISLLLRGRLSFVVRPFRVVHEAKASHYISNWPCHCEEVRQLTDDEAILLLIVPRLVGGR